MRIFKIKVCKSCSEGVRYCVFEYHEGFISGSWVQVSTYSNLASAEEDIRLITVPDLFYSSIDGIVVNHGHKDITK